MQQGNPTSLRVPDPGIAALLGQDARWQAWLDALDFFRDGRASWPSLVSVHASNTAHGQSAALARAERAWLTPSAELRAEEDAIPVARLYAGAYGFRLRPSAKLEAQPCAGAGRFAPRPANRVAIDRGSRLVCF